MRKLFVLIRWGVPLGLGAAVLWRRRARTSSGPASVAEPPLRLVNTGPSRTTGAATDAGAPDAGGVAPADAADAAASLGRKVVTDDLKIIEGIGPKIAELLDAAGISTWSALAACDRDRLKEVLADGGERFRIHEPATWPQQAALAASGDWAALKRLQDDLKGGRTT